MLYNFSIMTLDEEHIDEVCEDIAYQVKNGIATMPLGDPDNGIAPGTKWEDIPADFTCPVCGLDKDAFEVEE